MGYDLHRDDQTDEELSYYRWNMWGFPPVKYLAELYGWIPAGTTYEAWTDDNGVHHEEETSMDYDTNSGQTVSAEDAQAWADALKLAIPDLRNQPLVKETEKGRKIDDEFMKEREEIHNKIPDTLKRQFNTEGSIDYLEGFIRFLEAGEFRIY
jgi:hypothetical protein